MMGQYITGLPYSTVHVTSPPQTPVTITGVTRIQGKKGPVFFVKAEVDQAQQAKDAEIAQRREARREALAEVWHIIRVISKGEDIQGVSEAIQRASKLWNNFPVRRGGYVLSWEKTEKLLCSPNKEDVAYYMLTVKDARHRPTKAWRKLVDMS